MSDDLIYESYRQIIYQVMQQLAGEANNGQMGYLGGYDPRRGNYAKYYGCRRSNRAGSDNVNLQRPSYISAPVPFFFKPRPKTSLFPIPNEPIDIPDILKKRGRGDREKLLDLPEPRIIVPGFDKLPGRPNFGLKPGRPVPGSPNDDARIVRPRYPIIFLPDKQQIDHWPIVEWEVYGYEYSENPQLITNSYSAFVRYSKFGPGNSFSSEVLKDVKDEPVPIKSNANFGSCSYIVATYEERNLPGVWSVHLNFRSSHQFYRTLMYETAEEAYRAEPVMIEYYDGIYTFRTTSLGTAIGMVDKAREEFYSVAIPTPSREFPVINVYPNPSYSFSFYGPTKGIVYVQQRANYRLEALSPPERLKFFHYFKNPRFLNTKREAARNTIFFYKSLEALSSGEPFQEIRKATGFFVLKGMPLFSRNSVVAGDPNRHPSLKNLLKNLKRPEKILEERTFWGSMLEVAVRKDAIGSYRGLISELQLQTTQGMTKKAAAIDYMLIGLQGSDPFEDKSKDNPSVYEIRYGAVSQLKPQRRLYSKEQFSALPPEVLMIYNYIDSIEEEPPYGYDVKISFYPRTSIEFVTILIPKSQYRAIFKKWLEGKLPKRLREVLGLTFFAYWGVDYVPPNQIRTFRNDLTGGDLVFETASGGEEFKWKDGDGVYEIYVVSVPEGSTPSGDEPHFRMW